MITSDVAAPIDARGRGEHGLVARVARDRDLVSLHRFARRVHLAVRNHL
jgi:hypothetical protein